MKEELSAPVQNPAETMDQTAESNVIACSVESTTTNNKDLRNQNLRNQHLTMPRHRGKFVKKSKLASLNCLRKQWTRVDNGQQANKIKKIDNLGDDGNIPQFFIPAVRLVDLNLLAVKLWCQFCDKPLSLRNCVDEKKNMFKSLLQIQCTYCDKVREVSLSWVDEKGGTIVYEGRSKRRVLRNDDDLYRLKILSKTSRIANKKAAQKSKECKKVAPKKNQKKSVVVEPLPSDNNKQGLAIESTFSLCLPQLPNTANYILPETSENGNLPIAGTSSPVEANQDFHVVNIDNILKSESEVDMDCDDDDDNYSIESEPDVSQIPEHLMRNVRFSRDGPDYEWEPMGMAKDESEGPPREPQMDEVCYYCPEKFETIHRRRAHMVAAHEEFSQRICGTCGVKSASDSRFKTHLRRHRADLHVVCDYCGESVLRTYLKIHQQRHQPKSIVCPKCPDKAYASEANLIKHNLFVHVTPFKCDFCAKSIRGRWRFTEHIKTHVMNRKYKCLHCSATFERRDNRNTHVKNNHNFVCLVCSAKFTTASLAKDHTESSHTQQEISDLGLDGNSAFEKVTKFRCQICLQHFASNQSLGFHTQRIHGKDKDKINDEKLKKGGSETEVSHQKSG
ncbi:protein suppressor of hairy wing-like [Neocloeon triangulifer]|uniref:protein suppressor of hairy wing-like n=1 Tax=Neocloeon triangulifer TaxID=2078957 RepID=UPI00286F3730|nr:protein suppressor of hairy wing-like [Neocloeon triangulifer]